MKPDDLHAKSVVCRAKEVLFSRLDDELLAIDSQAGYCYSLNETAGMVWDLIAEPMRIRDICTRLGEHFRVDEAECLADVIELLQGLYHADLVKIGDEDCF